MWDFIQDEVFGMKWLNRLIGSLLNACGLDTESKLGGSLQFFIYDMIKIMVLLVFLMSIFGWKVAVIYVIARDLLLQSQAVRLSKNCTLKIR